MLESVDVVESALWTQVIVVLPITACQNFVKTNKLYEKRDQNIFVVSASIKLRQFSQFYEIWYVVS